MSDPTAAPDPANEASRGRLRPPRPGTDPTSVPVGRSPVHLDGRPVGLCYLPRTGARRVVILLHGAGGTAGNALGLLLPHAEEHRLMLLAPQAVAPTWDVITGGYGPDVRRIQHAVDGLPAGPGGVALPVAVGGFSDGASYAISLGLINGDLLDAVLAFSPGFAAPTGAAGQPEFFVSHGRADKVLPIDRCSRRLVPRLRGGGYRVRYHEFDGGHEVPAGVVGEALAWLSTLPHAGPDQ